MKEHEQKRKNKPEMKMSHNGSEHHAHMAADFRNVSGYRWP